MQRQCQGNKNKGFRRNNSSNDRSFIPIEMHKAVCSEYKQECEVPLKPSEDRPVYCKECYMKKK